MRVVTPVEVTDAILTSTNVVNEAPDWTAGTYTLGQQRIEANRVYEVVAASTTDQPSIGVTASPPSWILMGWSNQLRMFRAGRDSLSTRDGGIDVTLNYAAVITTFAALGLKGQSATLIVTDPIDGVVFSKTVELTDIGAPDWWEYFFTNIADIDTVIFEGIPPFPAAAINFVVEASSPSVQVAVGRVAAGAEKQLGVTNYGTSVSLVQFSSRERDGFGNLTLVPRRSVRLVNYNATVKTQQIDFIVRSLEKLSGEPALFIGDNLFPSTVTFGVYRDFTQAITDPSGSDLTIQVEGF